MAALRTIGLTALFVIVMLTVVARVLRPIGAHVERTGRLGFDQMHIVVGTVLPAGWFTDHIGIYSVFGGFVAGLAMPRNAAFREALPERFERLMLPSTRGARPSTPAPEPGPAAPRRTTAHL